MQYRDVISKLKRVMLDDLQYGTQIEKYKTTRVLLIDDFLKGKNTESDINIMYEIINCRYINHLPVIVSTEKSVEEIIDFDEAVGTRIVEMCKGNIVRLKGAELNYRIYGDRN